VSEGGDDTVSTSQVSVAPATVSDAESLLEMRERLSTWLATRGVVQWRRGSLSVSRLLAQIQAGEVFVARLDGHLAGSFSVTDHDLRIWGGDPTEASYLHRLMVDRRWAHRHLGAELLSWAEEHCRARGRTHLRLDCVEINTTLIDYYTRAGFREVRRVSIEDLLPHEGGLVLFEKTLTGGSAEPTTRL
jgi:GNAT superfamily N-acetyltransferase